MTVEKKGAQQFNSTGEPNHALAGHVTGIEKMVACIINGLVPFGRDRVENA